MNALKYFILLGIWILGTNASLAQIRTWQFGDGTVEAKYISVMGDKVILELAGGKQVKYPYDALSDEDKEWISLSNPPRLSVDFVKSSSQRIIATSPVFSAELPPRINDFTFGAKVKQTSAGDYPYPLQIEYFAIGQEKTGNKYMLLDRDSSSFTLTRENDLSYSFKGSRVVEIMDYISHGLTFGRQYGGNLVIITDKRGVIIAHSTSNKWLYENIENLRQLPIGAYFDETCTRCYPTPPKCWY